MKLHAMDYIFKEKGGISDTLSCWEAEPTMPNKPGSYLALYHITTTIN